MRTAIEWTDETWNPLVGCSRVSPGCDHCYAVGVAHRKMSPQHVGLTVKPDGAPTDWTGEVRVVDHLLDQPLRWRRPRRVFVNSLSDLFHPEVSEETIARIFGVMAAAREHTFQVLTKRPQRMGDVLRSEMFALMVEEQCDEHTHAGMKWPLPNVWLGTSIESDRYSFRAEHLRNTPAAVRFVSAEPLLGPLDQLDLTGIDWLIVGGESGPGARPMHPEWVRDLRDRCLATGCPDCHGDGYVGVERPHSGGDIAGVPVQCRCRGESPSTAFFFKQWGEWLGFPSERLAASYRLAAETGALHKEWRDGRRFTGAAVRVGKKTAGRDIDGRTWDEYPEAAA